MNILIVFDITPQTNNPFVGQLLRGLQRQPGCRVVCSVREFWDNAEAYDIIHFQWPDAIFDWHWPDQAQLEEFEQQLIRLKSKGVKLIYTRHNVLPHEGNQRLMAAYRLVERYTDAIVHLGDYSRREFLLEHPDSTQMQAIVPHHIYEGEYDTSTSGQVGRQALGIAPQAFVVLAFGTFRHEHERELLRGAFRRLKLRHKFLLAPRYFPYSYHSLWHKGLRKLFARTCYLTVRAATYFSRRRITSPSELIPDAELPWYLAAADVVFIQRTDILNSGNVTLAFLFGKTVVGPDCGNIGEMLHQTGNPTFDPSSEESVDRALAQAVRLSQAGHGERNRAFALEKLSVECIASRYTAIYQQLIHGQ